MDNPKPLTSSIKVVPRSPCSPLTQNILNDVEDKVIYPIVGFSSNIEMVPLVTEENISSYRELKTNTQRQYKRSYKFLTEGYIDPSSLGAQFQRRQNLGFITGKCYRSMKKTGRPYLVMAAIKADGNIRETVCECKAGKGGCCNHAIAQLRLVALLQKSGYSRAPPSLACTELPQSWNRPRGKDVPKFKLNEINWESPKEGKESKKMESKLYEARRFGYRTKEEESKAMERLKAELIEAGDKSNVPLMVIDDLPWIKTQMGEASQRGYLSYQLNFIESGYEVIHSLRACDKENTNKHCDIPEVVFPIFKVDLSYHCGGTYFPLSETQDKIFHGVVCLKEMAIFYEKNSRSQSNCQLWLSLHKHRVTSSNFGKIVKRKSEWSNSALNNFINPPDLSKVRAVQYGNKNEDTGVFKYEKAMKDLGHQVVTFRSGIVIPQTKPWLGASPDRVVYDPQEYPPLGLVEVKSPYSYATALPSQACNDPGFYMQLIDGKPQLKLTSDYYSQVIGQLGLTGFSWCDFVVYFPKGIIISRIQFDPVHWNSNMVPKLEYFYFSELLPAIEKSQS